MSVEKVDVHYVAKLARIALTEEESTAFSSQLGDIVEHVRQLEKLDLGDLETADPGSASASENHLRPDEPEVSRSLDRQSVLGNAPRSAEGEIVMPKIVE